MKTSHQREEEEHAAPNSTLTTTKPSDKDTICPECIDVPSGIHNTGREEVTLLPAALPLFFHRTEGYGAKQATLL